MADQQQPPQQPPQDDNEDDDDDVENATTYSSDSDSSDEDPTPETQQKLRDEALYYRRPGDDFSDIPKEDNSEAANIERFNRVLNSRRYKRKLEEEERRIEYIEDLYNFPPDYENWREEDLKELWADPPIEYNKPGWDPALATWEDWEVIRKVVEDGEDPPIAPFYLPYRKCYPAIPDNHHDISNPKAVIEELDRIEEFLKWVSFVFRDGSS